MSNGKLVTGTLTSPLSQKLVDGPIGQRSAVAQLHQGVDCHTVYYDESNATKEVCDLQFNNRFKQGFTSFSLPGSALLQIPNVSILDTVYAHLVLNELNTITASSNAAVALPRGWGWQLIDRIDYRIGSSTTYTLNGINHFMNAMKECETVEKRNELMDLGGKTALVLNAGPAVTAQTSFDPQSLNEAYIPLSLPISRIRTLMAQLPLDLSLLSTPVQITVYFLSLSSVVFGNDSANWINASIGGGGNGGSQLASTSSFKLRQGDFVYSDESMSSRIKNDPQAVYDHLITFNQPFQIPFAAVLSPVLSGSSLSPQSTVQITLTSFRFGTLKSITLAAIRNADLTGSWPTFTNSTNWINQKMINRLNFIDIRDITLTYNGQIIYIADGDEAKCYQTQLDIGPSYFNTAIYGLPQSTQAITLIDAGPGSKCYLYEIPISQFSTYWEAAHLQSGIEIGQNTVQLSFTVMKSSPAQTYEAPMVANEPCTLFANYNYNSGIKIENQGTRSDLIF
jgi:hypothetical protein